MTHICISNLTIIGSDNNFTPGLILIIRPLGNKSQQNFNRNSYIFIQVNDFENVIWKIADILLGLNVLKQTSVITRCMDVAVQERLLNLINNSLTYCKVIRFLEILTVDIP